MTKMATVAWLTVAAPLHPPNAWPSGPQQIYACYHRSPADVERVEARALWC